MAAVTTKSATEVRNEIEVRNKLIANRRAEFTKKYFTKFTGTLAKPYDLLKVKGDEPRPTAFEIAKNIPDIEEYKKHSRSKVVIGDYDIVLTDKNNITVEEDDEDNFLPEASTDGRVLFVNRKTGTVVVEDVEQSNCLANHTIYNRYGLINCIDSGGLDKYLDNDKIFTESNPFVPRVRAVIAVIYKNGEFILNADEDAADADGDTLVGEDYFDEMPTVSFDCLANLIANRVVRNLKQRRTILEKANLKVLDFTPEVKKHVSPGLLKEYTKLGEAKRVSWRRNQKPPEAGFSLIVPGSGGIMWHKSATVVIREKKTFLMGQDEGTYFGCILKDHPKTVTGAYESLIPESAKGIKGVIRQGEWFAIPVADKVVPDKTDSECLMWGDSSSDCCSIFPVEDKDSNRHCIYGEIIFTKSGKFFARNFGIQHDDHAELRGDQGRWYTFDRNTALASYSAEKVD